MTEQKRKILIIEDDLAVSESIKGILEDEGYKVYAVESGEDAIAYFDNDTADIALIDIWLPGIDGLTAMTKILEKNNTANFIVMSGHGNIETAVKATKLGAFDYLEKPISMEKLLLTIKNLLAVVNLKEENTALKSNFNIKQNIKMLGESFCMNNLLQQIMTIAKTDSSVLITGENGTGKELVSKLIHANSLRNDQAFIDVNCAAIPEELIESELFGHEKGAFTGAVNKKRGKFDLANNGTLFLDEIGDMSLKTQAKILRILEEQKFERVGGTQQIKIDVRIIAATNKNLKEEIAKNNFREDLFYRLNVIPVYVPPLRERNDDILKLFNYYTDYYANKYKKQINNTDAEIYQFLKEYNWPGNVRELKNIVERIVIMNSTGSIKKENLPLEIFKQDLLTSKHKDDSCFDDIFCLDNFKEAKDLFEYHYLKYKLEQNEGNISKTARLVGLDRTSLHRKLGKS